MAKLILTIEPRFQNVEKSIGTLKTKIEGLIPSFSLKGAKVDSELIKGLELLKTTLASIKVDKDLTNQIKALTNHYKELGVVVKNIAKEYTNLSVLEDKRNRTIKTTTNTVQSLQKKYADLLSTIKGIESKYPAGTFDNLKASVQSSLDQIKALNTEIGDKTPTAEQAQRLQQLTNTYQRLSTQVSTVRAETEKHTTAVIQNGDSILKMAQKFIIWQAAATLVMKPLQWIRSALSSINETLVKTEDAVIALQRVLPNGSATDNEISSRLYKIAQDYGQTFENVSQIAQNFARSGMSWADTIKATEAAVLALNVAELDATEASDGMIAILTQFGLKAEDLTLVVDKLNITADNAAVTTEKLLAALQRTGSAASNANLSLDETLSIITALSEATGRSGENLGTALNSLIQYSSKASALDTFAKLSDDTAAAVAKFRQGGANILEVWQAVSKEIQNLKNEQADLLDNYFNTDDGNALKEALDGELEDIYTELGGVYDTANTFRKNYFIALLGNMDTVEQAMGTLQDANGYSQTENQKYLDTYTAKLNSLQAKWQDIANDEQGLLGIKKDLLDMGNGVLDIIQGIGGLKTALIALGVVVGTIVLSFKGEAIIATLTKIGTLLKSLTIDAIPNAIGAWKSFAKGISSAGTALQASLPLITAVIIAISALDSAIRRGIEEREEAERKAIEQQNEAIAKANEKIETQKKEVAQMSEVATSVENLRKILDDSSQTEEEKAKAQDKLLQIQNTLVESNNKYKDSLDLTNGSLKEQLGLIEQLTTEQLKQKARDFLETNDSEIKIAQSRLDSTSTTNTDYFLTGVGNDRYRFRDIINKAIQNSGVSGANLLEDNEYGYLHGYFKDIAESKDFWSGFSNVFNPFDNVFSAKGWTGEANAGFSFSGTDEQKIDAITKLQEYIAKHRDELGLSAEEHTAINSELEKQLGLLNSEEYKQVQLLAERAKLANDYLNKRITEEEFLEKFYGIQRDISKEIGDQTNDISKVTGAYDDLISKLEELRDLQKESTEWEEKKLAVLEAEQALENAKNEATVRRFNQATGQWEWQTDEKKIAEAEKNLEQAQLNLQESAYNNIIDQLKEENATNDSILAILKEVAPLLGEDFSNAVQNAIKDKTGVDITKPIITPSESHDNGGLALGKGFINKATDRPESVNNPELTKKILSPVSNAEFNRYVRDMGIMFERSHEYAQTPVIERVGGAVDNRVNNSGQVFFNGVNIGSDKRDSSLNECLALAGIIPND